MENSHLKGLLNSIPDRLQDIAWEFSTEKREDDYGREEDDYGYNHDDGDISCSSSSSCESWVVVQPVTQPTAQTFTLQDIQKI